MRYLMIITGLVAFLFFHPVSMDAQENQGKAYYKHGLGVAAGSTTAYGLSYRYYMKPVAFQFTAIPNYSRSAFARFHSGLTFMYHLVPDKKSSFFLYQSTHWHMYRDLKEHESIYDTDKSFDKFNTGLGFGAEFNFHEQVVISVMAGYAAYRNFSELNVTGELGLHYLF
ncbi:MAG: hypothetical protein ACQES1_06190 [Bacteroidota bacterium]